MLGALLPTPPGELLRRIRRDRRRYSHLYLYNCVRIRNAIAFDDGSAYGGRGMSRSHLNPMLWNSWLRKASARLKRAKRSGRSWSSQAGITEHTVRRALLGDESIAFASVEALLVAAGCKFKFRFPNGEGDYTTTALDLKRPLRDAVVQLLRYADCLGTTGVAWARQAAISEATIRRLRKRDPQVGIGMLFRLLDSAHCSVARDYRPEPPIVIPLDDP